MTDSNESPSLPTDSRKFGQHIRLLGALIAGFYITITIDSAAESSLIGRIVSSFFVGWDSPAALRSLAIPLYITYIALIFSVSMYASFRLLKAINAGTVINDIIPRASIRSDNQINIPPTINHLSDERKAVVSFLTERVHHLNGRSNLIISVIFLAIIVAVFVIIFAGTLTSYDASAVGLVDRVKGEISSLQSEYSRLDESLFRTLESQQKALADFKLDKLPDNNPLVAKLNNTKNLQEMTLGRIFELEKVLADAWKKEVETARGYGDDKYIVATAITRVGVVLVLVFLVQILIGLYRYNVRIIAFYQARKDFVVLWSGKMADTERLSTLLTPANIDFGKDPKHPLEDIINAVTSTIEKKAAKPSLDTINDSRNRPAKSKSTFRIRRQPSVDGENR